MTNSWNPSLGINTSKTNYLQTEVDMTEATNKQIDENVKMMNAHFDSLIKMNNASIKARTQGWKELANFTTEGRKFVKWARDKADARAALNEYYSNDPDKVKSRVLNEVDLNVNEAELDDQKRINYTAAGEIEAIDPDTAAALKETGNGRAQSIELLGISFGQSADFFERAKDTVQVEVEPGVWKTWNEPGGLTAIERSIISKEIDEIFISQVINSGVNRRLVDKYLLKPMLKQHKERLTLAQAESIKGTIAQETEIRNEQFATKFNHAANSSSDPASAGAIIEDYLKGFAGYHAASSGMRDKGFYLAKQELQGFILAGIRDGTIPPEAIQGALDYELTPNDGGPPRTINEYLPTFAGPIRKAVNKALNDKQQEAELALKTEQEDMVQPKLAEWRKNTPSEQEVQKFAQEYRAIYGESHPDIDNFWSKQDIDDKDIELELEDRYSKSGEIFAEDIEGITNPEMKEKWLKRVDEGGLTSKEITNRDNTIKTLVNQQTLETDGDKDKSFKWDTIYNNAIDKYDEIYREERSQGQSHRTAKGLALKETMAYIQTEKAATRWIEARDENKADNINKARSAIIKDNSVIDSEDLLPGEAPELKAGLRYVKTGKGTIPQYYRSFPNINLTAYELLQRRLVATGMLKSSEAEPIPERQLDPTQQDLLLNKPSPARTYRALLDEHGVENLEQLVEITEFTSVEELLRALRSNSQRNNKTAGWEVSQVNIDPTLEEEHTQIVGEQPPFMRLNTLLPGVATAYVEDTYNV